MEKDQETENDSDTLIYDIKSDKQKDSLNIDYRNSNYKMIKIYFDEISDFIYLKQDHKLGKGGILWDCSFVLTKVLIDVLNNTDNELINSNKKDFRILELGAGTSLPSIIANKIGYKTIIKDLKPYVTFIEYILEINKIILDKDSFVCSLNWENKDDILNLKNIHNAYDIIMGSDILYLDEYFDDLINLFKTLSKENTKIIISFKVRLLEVNQEFFNKFSKSFDYAYVPDDFIKNYYPHVNKLKVIIAKLKI